MRKELLDISVVIMTKNEEKNIEKCILSAPFAKEILVIDSGSTDATREIAERLGAKVVFSRWSGDFSRQRNIGDSFARCKWILQLDADETATLEMESDLREFFSKGLENKFTAGRFPRRELFFGKWMEHGGWFPQYMLRFYRKGSGHWTGMLHESFKTDGEVLTFPGCIRHYSQTSISVFIDKFNGYTSMEAEKDFAEGKNFSVVKLLFQPIERFFGRYVLKKGYKDGFHGFVVAALFAFSYFLRHLKLWEKHYKKTNRLEIMEKVDTDNVE